jgi:riboflavin kinase/FMN adenylyltransferase
MNRLPSLQQANLKKSWLTIGVFDGVHLGHQELIGDLVAGARAAGAPAVVLTFDPHPAEVLRGPRDSFYLTNVQEKAQHIESLGVDTLIVQTFDQTLANTTARDFAGQLKTHLGLERLLVGPDFALGHNREGDVPRLGELGKELGFEVQVVAPVELDGEIVSSSRIRKLLTAGDAAAAARLLGRPYTLAGEVVSGAKRGRSIGIPTANIQGPAKRLVPASGVYVCKATVGSKTWGAVTNIGVRPTFEDQLPRPVVEAHLLDYDGGEFYGQVMQLQFLSRLRPEQKFSGVDALVAQIHADIEVARKQLAAT